MDQEDIVETRKTLISKFITVEVVQGFCIVGIMLFAVVNIGIQKVAFTPEQGNALAARVAVVENALTKIDDKMNAIRLEQKQDAIMQQNQVLERIKEIRETQERANRETRDLFDQIGKRR